MGTFFFYIKIKHNEQNNLKRPISLLYNMVTAIYFSIRNNNFIQDDDNVRIGIISNYSLLLTKKKNMKVLTPFKTVSPGEKWISITVIATIIMVLWGTSTSNFLPTPLEILSSFPRLMEKNLIDEFITSIVFCLKCMMYATVVSVIIGYLSVIPAFSMLCQFLKKFRFLPSIGFSFLFMKLTGNIDEQKTWMMTFGIMTWLTYSMVEIALSISKADVMYAKSLRLSRWDSMRELLIFGKAAEMCKAVVGNFAIAWMLLASIENIAKSSGGIGVILSESNKYYHFDEVYSVQILILLVGIMIDYLGKQLVIMLFPYTKL